MSEGSDFDIFLVPSRRAHHPGGGALDHRLGQREEVGAEVVVELRGDVAGQLDVLLLVLADRDVGGRGRAGCRPPSGTGRRRARPRRASRSLPALSLNWVMRFSQPRRATQLRIQASSACAGTWRLVEEDRARRGRGRRRGRPRRSRGWRGVSVGRVLPDGDRVQVDDAVDASRCLVLHRHPAPQRAEVVAERQVARGLDAGKRRGGCAASRTWGGALRMRAGGGPAYGRSGARRQPGRSRLRGYDDQRSTTASGAGGQPRRIAARRSARRMPPVAKTAAV